MMHPRLNLSAASATDPAAAYHSYLLHAAGHITDASAYAPHMPVTHVRTPEVSVHPHMVPTYPSLYPFQFKLSPGDDTRVTSLHNNEMDQKRYTGTADATLGEDSAYNNAGRAERGYATIPRYSGWESSSNLSMNHPGAAEQKYPTMTTYPGWESSSNLSMNDPAQGVDPGYHHPCTEKQRYATMPRYPGWESASDTDMNDTALVENTGYNHPGTADQGHSALPRYPGWESASDTDMNDTALVENTGYNHSGTADQGHSALPGYPGWESASESDPLTPVSRRPARRGRKRCRPAVTAASKMNTTLEQLRGVIPSIPRNTKLSKLKTIQVAIDYIRHLDQLLHATDPKQVDKFKVNFMRRRRSNASLISSSPASSSSSSPVSSSSSSSSPISSSTMNEHDAKEKNAETDSSHAG